MGQELEPGQGREWQMKTLEARINALKAAESVLTGTVVWWELAGLPAIDENGGELEEIRRLGSEAKRYYTPEIQAIVEKGDKAVVTVWSGGGALMLFHLGVLGALLERGVPIEMAVGTSAGSIVAMIASRINSLDDWLRAKHLAQAVNWDHLRVAAELRQGGLWLTDKLAEYIDENISRFEKSQTQPVLVVADISKPPRQKLRVQWGPPTKRATMGLVTQASCAVPGAMVPVGVEDENGEIVARWWDGGAIFKDGFEPLGVADVLAKDSLKISVRLGAPGGIYPDGEPDVRIEPCQNRRKGISDMYFFDRRDIYYGYLAGAEKVEQILALMEERGIKPEFRKGFLGPGQLLNYFDLGREI